MDENTRYAITSIISVLTVVIILYIALMFYNKSTLINSSKMTGSLPSVTKYLSSVGASHVLDSPLSDFFVCSSHNSYLGTTQIGGDVSHVKNALFAGARNIELDIHAINISGPTYPAVLHTFDGSQYGTYVTSAAGSTRLEIMLSTIKDLAFRWTDDPLIIHLEIFNADNSGYMREIGNQINNYLGDRLYEHRLTNVFARQGVEKYLPNAPLRSLIGKIAIIVNYYGMNPDNSGKGLDNRDRFIAPYVHATTDEPDKGWYGSASRAIMRGQESKNEAVDSFKQCARVYPSLTLSTAFSGNYDIQPFLDSGYTFISLNFGWWDKLLEDAPLKKYMDFFKNSAFIPKMYYYNYLNGKLVNVSDYYGTRLYQSGERYAYSASSLFGLSSNQENITIPKGTAYRNWRWICANYIMRMQSDGNLVIYYPKNKVKWASNTYGNPNSTLVMQTDGNLVIYNQYLQPIWTTWTVNPNVRGAVFNVSDGNLYVVDNKGKIVKKVS